MKYDKSSAFGLLNGPFPCANIPSTTCFLQSVISPSTMKISDNIYRYCLRHCASGGPQVKGIDFYQPSSPVIATPILRIIVAIAVTYHLTIVIAMSQMPSIILSRLPMSVKLLTVHPITYTGLISASLTPAWNLLPMTNI